ncbi:MAG TPA: acetyl-CoA carboxylase biotin carboxylase subunit [Candidatus Hydrogenedentes bacterium]|nr:acetyl-CoA carboxylase biotin carboxylase subunit [Candidatus Hydrogenedentota bacterium]HOS03676.1 acetyl-CoA carboxylase biotin carboxylase subunit [Candidatus Hydrogenedentota bacterium]
MFRRILIANRGEIAVRVIRACREMGITSIAVYSKADQDCLHTSLADESICIGPPTSTDSYLHIPSIVAAAEICDAQAIHPGYGFLSENPKFASICRECHIGFIGPTPEAISLSGNKSECRAKVKSAGVPVVPGSEGLIRDPDEALKIAKAIGFPVLVKASAGGGGRGMRIAHNDVALKNAVSMASNEAAAAFGDGGVYLEKFVENARHVEFQIFGDNHGRLIALGERECSIQRRHQKLIEETPSPALNHSLRNKMAKAAVRAAKAIGYTNAGTAEFLLAPDNQFYFIEFNARIQVEHPVTEEVMGVDLVKEQIRVAAGDPLRLREGDPHGCAIEARVYAEDPDNNFAPNPGTVTRCHFPGGPGVRVDSHLFSGYTVPRYYDSLLAKVIGYGETRDEAIGRLAGALDEFTTEGVKTTANLCARIIQSDRFRRGDLGPDMVDLFLPKMK